VDAEFSRPMTEHNNSSSRHRVALICIGLFVLAFGVRCIAWQNDYETLKQALSGISGAYRASALELVRGDFRTFLIGRDPPSDASVLAHPPGYPIFLALSYLVFGTDDAAIITQLLVCSLIPIAVFLILRRLFGDRLALVGAVIAAASPQLAYNSALMLPDEISVLPILAAIWCLVRLTETSLVKFAAACGFFLGISCWLRPNSLLLPVVVIAVLLMFARNTRALRQSMVLLAAMFITIAPVTIRNTVVFGSFIPLSLGSGVNIMEGIADLDTADSLGLAATDEKLMAYEAERYSRPDYSGSFYDPDGIERERFRWKKSVEAVSEHPIWFVAGVAGRASSFIRLERVPTIAAGRMPVASWQFPLYMIQRLFITAVFLPLFALGIVLLAWRKENRKKLAILLVVPVYFLCLQSWFHTEYRYLLAMHCFELMIAAVAIDKGIEFASKRLQVYRQSGAE
jgi:4-amino-4-deoxy-L-arabinose transferase-like glycosyltransferase